MDLIKEANYIFKTQRPKYFTDYKHCEECNEHNITLSNSHIDLIRLKELGNDFWDPICFVNNEGYLYYFPAFVRLAVKSGEDNYYITQFLFHLKEDRIKQMTAEQKKFLLKFLNYLMETKEELIESYDDKTQLSAAINLVKKLS